MLLQDMNGTGFPERYRDDIWLRSVWNARSEGFFWERLRDLGGDPHAAYIWVNGEIYPSGPVSGYGFIQAFVI